MALTDGAALLTALMRIKIMRLLTMTMAMMALGACASAVYDSLDRRGVDAKSVFFTRIGEANADIREAEAALASAAIALAAVDGLDGPALARQIGVARAAGDDAALAAQDLRLSTESTKAAAARYFTAREDEFALQKASGEIAAMQKEVAAVREANAAVVSSVGAATLRLSPALSLYEAEVRALRKNPTSGVAAAARAGRRASAIEAVKEAESALASSRVDGERLGRLLD